MREFARFFLVALGGVAIDVGLAWALATLVGLPLVLSAALGFGVATLANYVAHERWTFGRRGTLSGRRAIRYLGVLGLAFGTRIAVLALLQASLPAPQPVLAMLVAATGVSFVVNYLASKRFVFTDR